MANIKRTKLVLRFNIGTEDAPKYKDVTYTHVAEEASDDNVKTVGNALAALYDHSLSDVVRVNESICFLGAPNTSLLSVFISSHSRNRI